MVTNKQLSDLCLELGDGYYVARIDFEDVIAKDIKSTFQFEISFLNPTKSKLKANIYVWQMKNAVRIVEQITEVKSLPKLQSVLASLTDKYNSINLPD